MKLRPKGKVARYLSLLLAPLLLVYTQDAVAQSSSLEDLPPERARGYLVPACIDEYGDTIPLLTLPVVQIFGELRFDSTEARRAYLRLVRDVKKTLPYAKLIANTMLETYEYLETLPDDKARRKHLKRMEKELYAQYSPELKKLTLSQGKLLIKLITRECGSDSYTLIDSFLGGFAAFFWNSFAKIIGASLKAPYEPEGKDALIEAVCLRVESGNL